MKSIVLTLCHITYHKFKKLDTFHMNVKYQAFYTK